MRESVASMLSTNSHKVTLGESYCIHLVGTLELDRLLIVLFVDSDFSPQVCSVCWVAHSVACQCQDLTVQYNFAHGLILVNLVKHAEIPLSGHFKHNPTILTYNSLYGQQTHPIFFSFTVHTIFQCNALRYLVLLFSHSHQHFIYHLNAGTP
jgi:hypothetical protein